MPKQSQVEGFEAELREINASYEAQKMALFAHHDGDMNQGTLMAVQILEDERRMEVERARIEWGLE